MLKDRIELVKQHLAAARFDRAFHAAEGLGDTRFRNDLIALQNRYRSGLQDLRRATATRDELTAHNNRIVQSFLEQLDELLEDDQQTQLHNWHQQARLDLAAERYEQALDHLNRIILTDPHFALAFADRGFLQLARGNPESAIQDLTTAIHLDPNNGDHYYNRAAAHYQLGRVNDARYDWRRAYELGVAAAAEYLEI